ncbi:MAG: NfeD family protein [Chloroflexota bacterium]
MSRAFFRSAVLVLLLTYLARSLFAFSGASFHSLLPRQAAQAADAGVWLLEVRGVINPPAANYIDRVFQEARQQNAALIVLRLDTPGGLDSAMREIIQNILASPVPVAVYVTPAGGRAASAGLFILTAAHFAAMAPGTQTGAAHPVALGGEADEVMSAKAENDAAATIRSLANQRGRNADWVERAVRESISATADEALQHNVIDLIARDVEDLLAQLDGITVQTAGGAVTLDLRSAVLVERSMNFAERFLHAISNPDIAFLLLSIGSVGILAELYNPGALFPGIAGAIALILAFFSLGNLPTNWAGVALVGFAILLFVAELNTEGTGVLGVGALVAFVLGAMILFRPFRLDSPALPVLSVNPWLVGGMAVAVGAFLFVVLRQLIAARRAPISTGKEHFIGQIVPVQQELNPRGRVWFAGQSWYAELVAGSPVGVGEKVRVVGIDSLTLLVEPLEQAPPPPPV